MKQLNLTTMAIIMAGALGAACLNADAASFSNESKSFFDKQFHTLHQGREYRGQRGFSVADFERERVADPSNGSMRLTAKDAELSFKNVPKWDYLNGPDGSSWFYTVDYEYEDVYFNEYYTEHLVREFTFTIYDSGFNIVGTIHDKLRFTDDEAGFKGPDGTLYVRDMGLILDPQVTCNFFNSDDKYEIMVLHARNTVSYTNHYFYSVYQIDGAKDEEGYDTCIATMEGRCADSFNFKDGSGKENFYYTFVTDPVIDWSVNDPNYVDKLNNLKYHLTTYTKSVSAEGPQKFFEYDVYSTRVPGDTTDGIYFMNKQFGNTLYFVYSQYEKPCFVDPRGGALDESQTPDNSFVIEVYKTTGATPEKLSETKISMEEIKSDEQLMYSFYSIGAVAWRNDIDMSVFGSPEAPAFIVKHDVVAAASIEDVVSSYDIYDNSGKYVKTIAKGSDALSIIDYIDTPAPMAVLATFNDKEDYDINFINLYSGEKYTTISRANNGDPVYINSFCVKPDGDGYKYIFEMQYNEQDDDGNYLARVGYFNNDGKLDHIDIINMGQDIQASMVNMFNDSLNPTLYDSDENMEYAVLVKRTVGITGTTRNEFLVIDDNGDLYAKFSADDRKGDPLEFTILPGNINRLMMVYEGNDFHYNVDLYDLPFLENEKLNGIDNVVDTINAALRYDGSTVYAYGCTIEIYNASGIKEANGVESVSVNALPAGIYVVVATDAAGNKTAVKIKR